MEMQENFSLEANDTYQADNTKKTWSKPALIILNRVSIATATGPTGANDDAGASPSSCSS